MSVLHFPEVLPVSNSQVIEKQMDQLQCIMWPPGDRPT